MATNTNRILEKCTAQIRSHKKYIFSDTFNTKVEKHVHGDSGVLRGLLGYLKHLPLYVFL